MDFNNWINWCRFCGNYETIIKVENSLEIADVIKKLLPVTAFIYHDE